MDCSIYVAKIKALIGCAVVTLTCVFVFTYAKRRFSHDVAHLEPACNFRDALVSGYTY